MSKKIFIKTFGCQMNEYDSNRILDTVKEIGFFKTNNIDEANCYLLNTCHIRDKAKEKVYHEIGRVKKNFRFKNKPLVIVAGCVAQAENEEMLKREPYIDLVIGPQAYHKINGKIKDYLKKQKRLDETEFDAISKFNFFEKVKNSSQKISSFLTIQEGCDKFCHFCVVPYTRGPEYSRPFETIINEARILAANGVKEITLLGQNVNAYRNENYSLSNLILEIEKIPGILRIRYTTSHPKDMTDDLIETYAKSKKLMPLVHLPVQSGSNKVLELMNRKHIIEDYFKIYHKLKKINSSIKFSSDFIVGYPGENENDFNDTLDLIKEIKFINSYSFIFSPRPGTVASKLELIDRKISLNRLEKIQKELFNHQTEMNKSLENNIIDVLVENKTEERGKFFGKSEYMTSVIFNAKEEHVGKIAKVKINKSNQNTLFGEIVKNTKLKVA
ncbi:tRNA (N6-isopentenyl adenosine(37)-C2)-methylthiotransferase MiaB [Candidatus Pelagibacter sp. HIMB1483]|uniref:tRNA (N6-isopentenyl adenosine(37)-C2)-methylthiotransferase MiaB n=1 Tax=Candidatus Pelagibacter sp. HIMB1483 TaxID=3415414 RepID=UPI003F828E42